MTKPTLRQLKTLIGNPDAYAVQDEEGDYTPVHRRVKPPVLRKHLEGEITIGTYIVLPPDQARTLVFDFDDKGGNNVDDELAAVRIILDQLDLKYGLEESGGEGKRYHLWVVADDYMPAETLYRLGRGIREEAGLPKLEVFPKQRQVKELGNLVKLPGGIHRVTGKPNNFVGAVPELNEVDDLEAAANKYPEITARTGGAYTGGVEYPCVANIQEGITEGGRNIHLFHLATMLRKFSLSDEHVELVIRSTNERFDPPLEEDELIGVLENSRESGPVCDMLDGDKHCGEQCIKARHPGLYTRGGSIRNAPEGDIVTVEIGERSGDEGKIVELIHPDLEQARALLRKPPRKRRGEDA
jgi:hypothetical protein